MSAGKERVYEGHRSPNGWVEVGGVTVNNRPLHNYDQRNTTNFEWGYGGGGPHGLALSILCDYFEVPEDTNVTGDTVTQPQYYWGAFLKEFVSKFPKEGFKVTSSEIAAWMATKPPFKEGGWETLR